MAMAAIYIPTPSEYTMVGADSVKPIAATVSFPSIITKKISTIAKLPPLIFPKASVSQVGKLIYLFL